MFEDHPGRLGFSVAIIKTLDEDAVRYFKKEAIVENITLDSLEEHFDSYCRQAIAKYNSWSKQDIKN